jgi:phytoene/squalene synthetase
VSVSDCAEQVRAGDPDRFLSAMTAPLEGRGDLMVLYAFNLQLARAPWVTQEPLIAEMRLQFWTDVVDDIAAGKPPRAHEVAEPLADLVRAKSLPTSVLAAMVQARRFDIYKEPHADPAAFAAYLDATSGHLMWLAARALGARAENEAIIRDLAYGAGLAGLLQAVPALKAAGRAPLVDRDDAVIAALAQDGLARMKLARGHMRAVPVAARAALRAGWQAAPILRQVARDPGLVAAGGLGLPEFQRRGRLLWQTMARRF